MPRIVDGDNLLGGWPGRKRSDGDRRGLAHEIARLARRERWRMVVVFDGVHPPVRSLGSDVYYSGHGRSADELILDILRREQDRRGWVVVTDDRSLADQCRHLGARVEGCRRFRQRLAVGEDGEKPNRVEDLDYWMKVFKDE